MIQQVFSGWHQFEKPSPPMAEKQAPIIFEGRLISASIIIFNI
jgi:hypothetical protein